MAGKPGSAVVSGTTEVVEAQKKIQLAGGLKNSCIGIWVAADSGNTGNVVVGDASVNAKTKTEQGLLLVKGAASVFIEISDPSLLFVDAETSKDKLTWLAVLG